MLQEIKKLIMKKVLLISIPIILIVIVVFCWWQYYFVFGEGVKSGQLNFIVKKGYIFKTWEGRIIQEGFKSNSSRAMQSNEFNFSIENDNIAKILELNSGQFIELRYKEYLTLYRGGAVVIT
jgi:hypothetical protein